MLYLLEITYTDKESVAIYHDFADELALSAEFDTKLGAAMKSAAYKGEILVAFDQTGKIIDNAFHYKEDAHAEIKDRLIWVTDSEGVETSNQKACADLNELQGDAYSKRGAAKKNAAVSSILTLGVTSGAIILNDYWKR